MENTEQIKDMKSTEQIKEASEERIKRMIEEDIKRMKKNESLESAEISSEEELLMVRSQRDQILSRSDWTQIPDVPEAIQSAWKTYRQQLRDIPENFTDMKSLTWPTQPAPNA